MFLVVAVAILVIVLTAYLSLLEASVLGIDDVRLATILRKQPVCKGHLKEIFRNKREHLSALVLLNTLVSVAGSSFIGALSISVFNSLGLVLFTGLLTYCMLVFAKMLPKVLAVQMAEEVLVNRAPLILFLRKLVKPVLWMALIWMRVFPLAKDYNVSRDDLHSIIRHYNKRGVIRRDERKLAHMALAAEQQTLADLFSDPGNMLCVSAKAPISSLEDLLRNKPRKRYLVLEDDKPVGVVLYRHLARCFVRQQMKKTVGQLMRQTIHLPPETNLLDAVQEFREANTSVALIAGEKSDFVHFVTAKQVYQALLKAS